MLHQLLRPGLVDVANPEPQAARLSLSVSTRPNSLMKDPASRKQLQVLFIRVPVFTCATILR